VQEGFRLTPKGEQVAAEVEKSLYSAPASISKRPSRQKPRGKEEAVIQYIRESAYFQRWLKNPLEFVMTPSEFRSLLNSTLETPRRVLRQNLHFYRQAAQELNDLQIQRFLDVCERQHRNLLSEPLSAKGRTKDEQGGRNR
jgi:hypothetical protein